MPAESSGSAGLLFHAQNFHNEITIYVPDADVLLHRHRTNRINRFRGFEQ